MSRVPDIDGPPKGFFTLREVNDLELSAVMAYQERIIEVFRAYTFFDDNGDLMFAGSWNDITALIKGEK